MVNPRDIARERRRRGRTDNHDCGPTGKKSCGPLLHQVRRGLPVRIFSAIAEAEVLIGCFMQSGEIKWTTVSASELCDCVIQLYADEKNWLQSAESCDRIVQCGFALRGRNQAPQL